MMYNYNYVNKNNMCLEWKRRLEKNIPNLQPGDKFIGPIL